MEFGAKPMPYEEFPRTPYTGDAVFDREIVHPHGDETDEFNSDEFRQLRKWQRAQCGARAFLECANAPFNLGDVLVRGGSVDDNIRTICTLRPAAA